MSPGALRNCDDLLTFTNQTKVIIYERILKMISFSPTLLCTVRQCPTCKTIHKDYISPHINLCQEDKYTTQKYNMFDPGGNSYGIFMCQTLLQGAQISLRLRLMYGFP